MKSKILILNFWWLIITLSMLVILPHCGLALDGPRPGSVVVLSVLCSCVSHCSQPGLGQVCASV